LKINNVRAFKNRVLNNCLAPACKYSICLVTEHDYIYTLAFLIADSNVQRAITVFLNYP